MRFMVPVAAATALLALSMTISARAETPGKEEQWTISVQHSESDIDEFVEAFNAYCERVTRT